LIAVAALICASAVFAGPSQAVQWAGESAPYYLSSGQSGFLNESTELYASEGEGENRAVCAGIRGYGDNCTGRGHAVSYSDENKILFSEPYLHNHDTEGGDFKGWYYIG
jgi:hypothetical protein